jgi:hypothetical protein
MQSMPSRFASRAVLAVFAAACATTSSFAQWSVVAYHDNQGRHWRQLNMTCGKTWDFVASKCPTDGVTPCTGTINNQNITGWVWATHAQVQELLAELGAGVSECSTSADATGDVFGWFVSTTNADLTSGVDGWTSTIATGSGVKGFVHAPWVRFDQDALVGSTCANHISLRSWSSTERGVWLFLPPCIADLNADGSIGPADLSVLLGSWGTSGAADLDGNGVVAAQDLAIVLASWGDC